MIDRLTRRSVYLALLLLIIATAGTWNKKYSQSTYRENLATHRKQFKVAQSAVEKPTQTCKKEKLIDIAPIYAITDQLDHLLARKKTISEQVKHVHGYTIQVYTGGSREEAFKIRNQLYRYYPSIKAEVIYDLPNYTVRIGKFLDKLEAYPTYAAIRKCIPQAIIRPSAFVNKPHVFINKQATGQSNTAPSVPATNAHYQREAE